MADPALHLAAVLAQLRARIPTATEDLELAEQAVATILATAGRRPLVRYTAAMWNPLAARTDIDLALEVVLRDLRRSNAPIAGALIDAAVNAANGLRGLITLAGNSGTAPTDPPPSRPA